MATIRFRVDGTEDPPKVIADDIVKLSPGDLVFFVGEGGAGDIVVDLGGDELGATLAGLVLRRYTAKPEFDTQKVVVEGKTKTIVKLLEGGGNDPSPDIDGLG